MIQRLRALFSKPEPIPEVLDISHIVQEVKRKEKEKEISLGQRIYAFFYKGLEFSLDREITKNYRFTVYTGKERLYSFTVFAGQGDYAALEKALEQIAAFIDGERKIKDLPKNDLLKGFFYGY